MTDRSHRYAMVRLPGMSLEGFSRGAALHPDLVRRFVALGLLDPTRDARGDLRFPLSQLARVARVQRLRAGLALNYASIGLVLDLLERIDVLESELRRHRYERLPESDRGATERSAARSELPWT
jgi:chaperone modulatory protein CbpM